MDRRGGTRGQSLDGEDRHRLCLALHRDLAEPARGQTAFAATEQYGRLRWQKSYPDIFRNFGWCSWNAYGHGVTEQKILDSVRSFRDKRIPLGFVLVDDGWLSVKNDRLTGFGADPTKFPSGLAGLARTLRGDYSIPAHEAPRSNRALDGRHKARSQLDSPLSLQHYVTRRPRRQATGRAPARASCDWNMSQSGQAKFASQNAL